MSETVTDNPVPKLPIESPLPTANEIHMRFRSLYPHIQGEAFEAILYQCAEEAEMIMLRLLRTSVPYAVVVNKLWINDILRQDYLCTRCGGHQIRIGYNHCPDCGIKIEWR